MTVAQEAGTSDTQPAVPLKTSTEDLQGWASVKWFSGQLSKDTNPVELHFGKSKYLIPRNYLITVVKDTDGSVLAELNYYYPQMVGSQKNDDSYLRRYDPNIVQVFIPMGGSVEEFNRVAITPVAKGQFTKGPYGLQESPDHTWTFHSNLYVDLRKPEQASIVINCPNDDDPPPSPCRSSYEAPGGLDTLIQFDKRLLPGWKTIVDTVHNDLSKFYAGELP